MRALSAENLLKGKVTNKKEDMAIKGEKLAIMLLIQEGVVLVAKEGAFRSGQKMALKSPAQDALNN